MLFLKQIIVFSILAISIYSLRKQIITLFKLKLLLLPPVALYTAITYLRRKN